MATQGTDAQLLTTAEAARLAGVSARSVRRAAQEGRIPAQQVDGVWWVQPEAVAAMRRGRGRSRPAASVLGQGTDGQAGDVAALVAVLVERLGDAERRAAVAEAELAQARRQLAQLEAPALQDAPSSAPADADADVAGARPAQEAPRPPWWRRWWGAAAST